MSQDVEHVFLLALSILELRLELFRRPGGLHRADELCPARPAWALRRALEETRPETG